MGSSKNLVILSLLLFLHATFSIQGRQTPDRSETSKPKTEYREVVTRRVMVGSRPPRCEGRCTKCGHCEAIQVPIVPQQGFPRYHFIHSTNNNNPIISYSRGDALSNYKPMSWKCKCGDSIFNP